MRVPTIGVPTSAPRGPLNQVAPVYAQADTQVARATAELGASVQRMGAEVAGFADRVTAVQQRADSLRVTEALTELERRTTRRLVGDSSNRGRIDAAFDGGTQAFLSTQGSDASARSAQALEDLAKDAKEVEDGLATPQQREAFRREAGQRLEASRRRVEGHVAVEFRRAEVAALEAKMRSALDGLEAGAVDEGEAERQAADVEARLRATLPPELADKAAAAWWEQVAGTRIERALGEGRYAEAESFIDGAGGGVSAGRARQWRQAIAAKKAAAEKQQLAVVLEQHVAGVIDEAKGGPDGFVDEAKVWAAVGELPPDKRDDARKVARDQLRAAQDAEKARVDDAKRQARALYNDRKRPDAELRGFLQRHDPDYLERLESDAEARWRRWKADRDGSAADRAAARREQASRDTIAREEFLALPADEQASVDLEVWTPGDVSDEARARLKHLQRNAKDRATRGLTVEEKRFVGEADRLGAQIIKPRRGQTLTPEQDAKRRALSAEASAAFGDFVEREKRAPTEAEQKEILGALLRDRVTEGPGLFSSTKEPEFLARDRMRRTMGPQQQAAPAPQPEDEVVPLPTTRRMRFPDGSVQPVSVEKLDAARRKGGIPVEE